MYGDFGPAAIDSPESVAENRKTLDLTFETDLDIARDLFKKMLSTDYNVLVRAFDRRLTRPSATLCSEDNRG